MALKERSWLTIDTDDERHHPRLQGHPRRSKGGDISSETSERFLNALTKFGDWHIAHPHKPVTMFLIADQLKSTTMRDSLKLLFERSDKAGCKLLIGCHGLTHRCWSAWDQDVVGFSSALSEAKEIIGEFAGKRARPWFRAPAGYIAPWMANVLAGESFVLDSSINPTPFLRIKSGKRGRSVFSRVNGWNSVRDAMRDAGIVERDWVTMSWTRLPVCGPALHIPLLGMVAKSTWKRKSVAPPASEEELLDDSTKVHTLYWHVLDHTRHSGKWKPPIA